MNRFIARASSTIAFFVLFNPDCANAANINQTFTESYQCNSTVNLKAQTSVSQQQLITSCNEIAETDQAFHDFFNTDPNNPLPNDNNDTLDVYIYLSSAEYKANAGNHFGISTDNGGMYLEGNPSNPGNQAKFIAHICEGSWVPFSCAYQGQVYNLQHEYVHYLDGRYNVSGPFGTFNYNAGLTEGLADYLAHGQSYARTINGVDSLDIPPLYNILSADYYHPDLYKWGYMAMHYMSNRHRNDYDLIIDALRTGNTATYRSTIRDVADRIGSGFDAYVMGLSNAVAINQGTLPADNNFGECNLEHKYVRYVDDPSTRKISVTNYSDVPMRLMWINNVSGDAGADEIALLNQGQAYHNDYWRLNDRFIMMSENRECVGIGVIGQTSTFEIDQALVANVVADKLPLPNEVGSCSLERPYFKTDETANATVTKNSNETLEVRWVNYVTGVRSSTLYPTLNPGDSYNANNWKAGDRMVFVDTNNQCKGVAVFAPGTNTFSVTEQTSGNLSPTAVINGPYNALENSSINFSSAGSTDSDGTITEYLWDFGDGNTSTLANPTHSYITVGTYNISLTVTDDENAADTVSSTVTINQDNSAGNGTDVPNVCASQSPITGGRLTAGEAACLGNSSAIWLSIEGVNNYNSITIRTAHGSGDLAIDYSNAGWPNGSYSEGMSSNAGNSECIHVTGGANYWGYLKVENSNGSASIIAEFDTASCDDTGGQQNTAPTAQINGPYNGSVNSVLTFSSDGSSDAEGPIASYLWQFGDGATSQLTNPSHTYSAAGSYTVSLTVTDAEGLSHSTSSTATITSQQNSDVADVCPTQSPTSGWVDINQDMCVPTGSWSNAIAYYGIQIPEGSTRLVISTDHGTGDGHLYYQASNWANETNFDQASEQNGNTETIIVNAPSAGYHYFSVVGAHSGMAINVSVQ